MDLLTLIQSKKKTLKHSQTIVTHTNGNRTLCDGDNTQLLSVNPTTAYGFIIDTKPDTTASCIISDFLYLGSQDSVNENNLRALSISHILSIGTDINCIFDTSLNIKRKFISCLDLPETNLNDIIKESNDFICECRENNGHILVHCNAGVSRSTTIVIAYLILKCNYNFDDAYEWIKSKRNSIRPNDGFVRQLREISAAAKSTT